MSIRHVTNKPFIIMMYGFPGSGKTGFARQISEELGAVHLQEDKIREDLFGGEVADSNQQEWLRTIMDYMTLELLHTGVSVIYDAPIIRANERKRVRELAISAKVTPILVWLQIDPETAFMRTQKRDRRKSDDKYAQNYTENTFRSVLARMQNPSNAEEYIVISGKHTFNTQLAAVKKKFYDLNIISTDTAADKVAKPGLINLIPQAPRSRAGDIPRRNVHIR